MRGKKSWKGQYTKLKFTTGIIYRFNDRVSSAGKRRSETAPKKSRFLSIFPVLLPSTIYLSLFRCIFDTAVDKKFWFETVGKSHFFLVRSSKNGTVWYGQ